MREPATKVYFEAQFAANEKKIPQQGKKVRGYFKIERSRRRKIRIVFSNISEEQLKLVDTVKNYSDGLSLTDTLKQMRKQVLQHVDEIEVPNSADGLRRRRERISIWRAAERNGERNSSEEDHVSYSLSRVWSSVEACRLTLRKPCLLSWTTLERKKNELICETSSNIESEPTPYKPKSFSGTNSNLGSDGRKQ